ncbi:osmolarity response regulator [Aquimixticola soesokkakensis]|uniref:Osmolarity response regulator n=1 Tax=Aquimixticola soesokkakensis TaxID=1519096 RepID=A0A1Y5T3X5_9RHOB|nr:response regulator [Aquimixticola soesokkakensis]SLN55267.1 osmolarity response regulator [Aquimixticola soesokkakensis]
MQALIVEDDPNLRFMWEETLEGEGFEVLSVDSCRLAMQALLRRPFDLVVLDLFVADGNTIALSDWVKIRTPATKMIMLTGSDVFLNNEHFETASSPDWFLRKPVQAKDLAAMANYLVG